MAASEWITARQRAILTAILQSYVETGEPVGSGTVVRLGVDGTAASPATVRNEMAALTAAGLLEQPHTSAGRVPTAKAFRMYVEELSVGSRIAPSRLPERSRQEIDSSFAGAAGRQALLERTSYVLGTLSNGVGVVMAEAATGDGDLLEHVHFSRLTPRRVLAVVVTRSGVVRDRILALDREITQTEIELATAFLNENFRGWNLDHVRAEILRRVEQERSEYQRVLHSVEHLWREAVPEAAPPVQVVYVGGVANLVSRHEDRARLRELLLALEAKERLIELLNAYVDAREANVRVVFGLEEQAPEMAGMVLIAAPARIAGESRGTVAVLGTTRMDYETTMNAVSYVAQVFDRMLPRTSS